MAELGGPSSAAEDQGPVVGVCIQAWVGQTEDFVVGGRGPTAASSMWHALLWWSRSFGLEWPLEHFTCTTFKMHAPGHRSVQAIELEPWEFFNMVFLMVRANGTNKIILALFVMTALSCVRFEHLQRSKFIRDHGSWAEFWCSEGKLAKKDPDRGTHGLALTWLGKGATSPGC